PGFRSTGEAGRRRQVVDAAASARYLRHVAPFLRNVSPASRLYLCTKSGCPPASNHLPGSLTMAADSEESLGQAIANRWHRSWLLCKLAFAVGSFLLLCALALEAYGEYQGIAKAQSLEKGAGQVATVPADKIDPANEGMLVHVVGEATTKETLADPEFDVSLNAIRLTRKVEAYQWQEKKESKKKGKETIVSYHYDLIWSAKLIDSSKYNDRGHDNPTSLPFEAKTWEVQEVTCGAFKLSPGLVKQITSDELLP